MKEAAVYIEKRKITNIKIANNFWTRFMGLMGKSPKQIENMGGIIAALLHEPKVRKFICFL